MAVTKPDELQHNNPSKALVDAEFVRGGPRVVFDRAGLYALSENIDQLRQYVTTVRVIADENHNDLSTLLLFINPERIAEPQGWHLLDVTANNPTYTPAELRIEQTAAIEGEVGELVTNVLTATFTQQDAGPLSAIRILRDGNQVGNAGASSPMQRIINTLTRPLGRVNFWASVDYAPGPLKLVPPTDQPDTRPAQVRGVDAPQAAETGFKSPAIYLDSFYKLFCGAVPQVPESSVQVRSLPTSQLTNQSNFLLLNTGTTYNRFVAWVPTGKRVLRVMDLDSGINITGQYEPVSFPVADASGHKADGTPKNPVPGTLYVMRQAIPYSASHRHQLELEDAEPAVEATQQVAEEEPQAE